jgi:O-antigen/teichoic acid export membrane protein
LSTGIKDFSFSFGSKIASMVLALAGQSCLAWTLGPAGRGSYAVCVIYTTLLSLVFILGCDIANVYLVASKKMTLSEGIVQTLIYGTAGSALAIVTGFLLLNLDWPFFAKADHKDFAIALIGIPVGVFSASMTQLMTAVKRFKWYAILEITNGAIHVVFIALFIFIFKLGVTGAILANIISSVVNTTIALIYFRREFGIKWVSPSKAHILEMLNYGLR